MPFESIFDPAQFDGTITATVHEHPSLDERYIIRTDQGWGVRVHLTNTGSATGMVGGTYHLHLQLESIGPGPELSLVDPGDHLAPLIPGPEPRVYHFHHVDIGPGVVPEGIYKLVVMVRYIQLDGTPGPMAAYEEIRPLLQFYNP